MNRLQTLINIVLLAAVSFLAYRVMGDRTNAGNQDSTIVSATGRIQPSIVFVNTDTLLEYYPLFEELKKAFEKKQDSIERVMASRMRSAEEEIRKYQERAATMTDEQRQSEEERLYRKQQELSDLRKNLLDHLSEEEERMMDNLQQDLIKILRDYNTSKGYHFILGYQKGSGILLASDSLNITDEVIEAVNKKALD